MRDAGEQPSDRMRDQRHDQPGARLGPAAHARPEEHHDQLARRRQRPGGSGEGPGESQMLQMDRIERPIGPVAHPGQAPWPSRESEGADRAGSPESRATPTGARRTPLAGSVPAHATEAAGQHRRGDPIHPRPQTEPIHDRRPPPRRRRCTRPFPTAGRPRTAAGDPSARGRSCCWRRGSSGVRKIAKQKMPSAAGHEALSVGEQECRERGEPGGPAERYGRRCAWHRRTPSRERARPSPPPA